ncbi:uncharacterized protein LOC130811423 [Amaranthus tricolor]|uniref:uncharacterized protein LOC130811423 n=1 Tax=Amaranthus tricolor TaxID=29722 RepID=UPI0025833BB6|nr:uncharacterized protein LOC130811423 [Amaranthus tricolor]
MTMMMLPVHFSCSFTNLPTKQFNIRSDFYDIGSISSFRYNKFTTSAAKSGGFSVSGFKKCEKCRGQGAIECPGCKGTGKNKKNGNIFERWKCFECQGFGLKSCPQCGKGGLTPEQRGER